MFTLSFKYFLLFLVAFIICIIKEKYNYNYIYEKFNVSSNNYIDNTLCIEQGCENCNNVNLLRRSLISNNNGEVDIDIIERISNEQRTCLNNIKNINMYTGYNGIHIYINNKVTNHNTIILKINSLLTFTLKDISDIYKNKLNILNIYIYRCDPTYNTAYGTEDTRDNRYNYITDYITFNLLLLRPSQEGLSPYLYNSDKSYDQIVIGNGGPETYPLLTICEYDLNDDPNYIDNKEQTLIHELVHLYYTNIVKIISPNIDVRLNEIYREVSETTCNSQNEIYLCRNKDEFLVMMSFIWFSATPLSNLYRDLDDNNYTINIIHQSWKNMYFDSNINTIDDIRNINGLEELLIDIFGGSYISNNYCNNIDSNITKSFICNPCLLYTDKVEFYNLIRPNNNFYTYSQCRDD